MQHINPSTDPINPTPPGSLPLCRMCGDEIDPPARAQLIPLCLFCGEEQAIQERASWCIAPLHKSNYMLISNRADLVGLNNKGGLVK